MACEAVQEVLVTDRPLNATAASLLGFLHDGPLTGWDLVAAAEERIGDFWSLTQSQVYRELAAMAAAGLVEAGERGRRDRQPYAITDAGRKAFAEWAAREPGRETIRFPLLLTVMFGQHVPADRLAESVARHRAVHAERLADHERRWAQPWDGAPEDEPYARATLEFGLAYERAVLAWFDALPRAIVNPAGTGAAPTTSTAALATSTAGPPISAATPATHKPDPAAAGSTSPTANAGPAGRSAAPAGRVTVS